MNAAMRGLGALLASRHMTWGVALLSPVLLVSALDGGFQLDDWFQRFRLLGHGEPAIQLFVFYDGDPAKIRAGMEAGWLPWWTALDLRHANLRYLSVLTMQLDYLLWPQRPELMHLHSLAWLGALAAAAALLYRSVLGATWAAGLAALLYAVEDAHALPAAYLANRNALIATCLGAFAVVCHVRWREGQGRGFAWLAPVCLALALLAGEIGLGTAAYLGSFALLLDRGSLLARARSLAPTLAVLAGWVALYKGFGFGAAGSGFYTDPLGDPTGFLAAAPARTSWLLIGQWTPLPADLGASVGAGDWGVLGWGVGILATLAFCLGPLLLRDRIACFFALATLLSFLPILATGPQDRLLFFVGLGSMGLLARLVQALVHASPPLPTSRMWRGPVWAFVALMAVSHLVLAPWLGLEMLAFHEATSERMRRVLESVPSDSLLAETDLLLLNPPDPVYDATAIPQFQLLRGRPLPRRLRMLVDGTGAFEVERLDAHTLEVRLEAGLFPDPFSRYFRNAPFAARDRVALPGLRVEVAGVDARGDPTVVRFRFDRRLDDPGLRWLRYDDHAWVPWTPPPVGDTQSVAPQANIFTSSPS